MTPNSVLALAPSTKEQITTFAKQIIESVESGNENALNVHAQIIALEKALAAVKDAIRESVLSEAEKHNQKSFSFNGFKIEIKELGVKYDYSMCNDPVMNLLISSIEEYKERQKERSAFLKAIKNKETIVDTDTGEVITIYPPIKTSTTGITVTPQ